MTHHVGQGQSHRKTSLRPGRSPCSARAAVSPQAGRHAARHSGARQVGSMDEDCPTACNWCREPGDCEDCLDCLYWPDDPDDFSVPPGPPRGPSVPTMARELAAARAQLHVGHRVGLVLRRFRRIHSLSQRALAEQVDADHGADHGEDVDHGEDADREWGVADLVARDAGGRRLPPVEDVRYRSSTERLVDRSTGCAEGPWTWHRPHPDLTPPCG